MRRFGSVLQSSWDRRAAGNFLFGGAGSGLLAVSAVLSSAAIAPVAAAVGALLIGLGLACVWFEIGRPLRATNVLRHPQTSWMTREAFVAPLVFVLVALGIAGDAPVALSAAGLAALAFLYCQARILRAAKGIPAWREPAIVPLVLVTGLTEGLALLLMLDGISGTVGAPVAVGLLLMVTLRLLIWHGYLASLRRSKAPTAALSALAAHSPVQWATGGVAIVLPAIGFIAPAWSGAVGGVAGLLALGAGWHMKSIIVLRAAHVQGYAFGKLKRGHPLHRRQAAAS